MEKWQKGSIIQLDKGPKQKMEVLKGRSTPTSGKSEATLETNDW